jgi:hypothetical protein
MHNKQLLSYENNSAPFRTNKKLKSYAKSNDLDFRKYKENIVRNSFPIKQLKKEYNLHFIYPLHSYIVDYAFFGKNYYMLAINGNTRKAYFTKGLKQTKSDKYRSMDEFDDLINQIGKVKNIFTDAEPSWDSDLIKAYFKYKNINHIISKAESHKNSIIDRFVKTLRTMLYNMNIDQNKNDYDCMKWLIKTYNESPHSTLSGIFNEDTCPNDMDIFKEQLLMVKLQKQNDIIRSKKDFNLKPGSVVKVFNDNNSKNKVKSKVMKELYTVVNQNNSEVLLRDKNGLELVKPRWKISTNI